MKSQNPHLKVARTAILGWGTFSFLVTSLGLLSAGLVMHAQQAPPGTQSSPPTTSSQASASDQIVTKGELIKKVRPKYPKHARKQHITGSVVMKATITKNGDVSDLQVVSGDPVLVQAALEAVKKWKYRPYHMGGQPVDVETTITVNFEPPR